MQTNLSDAFAGTAAGTAASAILRKCVHCGFCTATCPTYQLLGDELDGPRGRIYLVKQVLEGARPSAMTQRHLDRCLTCRACETTCPSGVEYGRLAEIGREAVDALVPRPPFERVRRAALRWGLSHRARFAPLLALARLVRPVLPGVLRRRIPRSVAPGAWPAPRHRRRALALGGCVQGAIAPRIDAATARVLDRIGISLVPAPGTACCGAVSQHLAAPAAARAQMRRNIDAWWPEIEAGAEAIVITASACALMVKEYAAHLADDPDYAAKAVRVTALVRDPAEILRDGDVESLAPGGRVGRVAFHSPCTLQHGQKLAGVVENILSRAGVAQCPVADSHLCCGSAGTYSILQAALSRRLLDGKLAALEHESPDTIATANIGCLVHIAGGAKAPVVHWIELLDAG